MYLLKKTHWVGVALGLLSGPALAATINCTITPPNSIITEGQTLQLAAKCVGGDLDSIDWKMDYIGDGLPGVSVTGVVPLVGHASGQDVFYTTPVGLSSSGSGDFRFSVAGVSAGNTVTSTEAQVIVQPTSGTVLAYDPSKSNPVAPIAGACGTSSGLSVQNMPTGTAQCSAGKPSLAISGPSSFTWSCLGLNGGTEANCYALRGTMHTVTATAGTGGSISPSGSQQINSNTTTSFTVTPSTGYNISSVTGCNGSLAGTTYATGAITGSCTVTANFAQQQSSYTVTASAGTGGSISPSGSQTVSANQTRSFTVTANSGYSISGVTGCNGSLNGSTYQTGPITATCSVTASFAQNQSSPPPSGGADPGSGSWWAGTGRLIADPTGDAAAKVSYLPGCLNGDNAPSADQGCARATSYDGFSFGNGSVLGLRFTSVSSLSSNRSFKVNTPYGGSVPSTLRAWLSADPASTYENVASACRSVYSGGSIFVVTGGTYCPIQPNTRYYLFLRDDSGAVEARYMVDESRADFN